MNLEEVYYSNWGHYTRDLKGKLEEVYYGIRHSGALNQRLKGEDAWGTLTVNRGYSNGPGERGKVQLDPVFFVLILLIKLTTVSLL